MTIPDKQHLLRFPRAGRELAKSETSMLPSATVRHELIPARDGQVERLDDGIRWVEDVGDVVRHVCALDGVRTCAGGQEVEHRIRRMEEAAWHGFTFP
jgi:hypothetical protein